MEHSTTVGHTSVTGVTFFDGNIWSMTLQEKRERIKKKDVELGLIYM